MFGKVVYITFEIEDKKFTAEMMILCFPDTSEEELYRRAKEQLAIAFDNAKFDVNK
jgi:hypothetical protein